jgi:hypothetical protein
LDDRSRDLVNRFARVAIEDLGIKGLARGAARTFITAKASASLGRFPAT